MIRRVKMKSETGFIFLEMLVSFIIWFVLFSTVIPSFLYITNSRKEILIDHKAHELLVQQATRIIFDEPIRETIVENNDQIFTFTVKEDKNWKEICVHYETKQNQEKQVCQKVHL